MRVQALIVGAVLATCAISPALAQDHQLGWGEVLARTTVGAGISYLTSSATGNELAGGVTAGGIRANSGQIGANLGQQALLNGTSTAVALGVAGASGPAVLTAGGVYAARTLVNGSINAAVDHFAPGEDGVGKTFVKAGLTALGWAGIASFAGASAPLAAGAGALTVVSGRILNWAFTPPPTYGNGLIGPAWIPPNVPLPHSEPIPTPLPPVEQSELPQDAPPPTPTPLPTPTPTTAALPPVEFVPDPPASGRPPSHSKKPVRPKRRVVESDPEPQDSDGIDPATTNALIDIGVGLLGGMQGGGGGNWGGGHGGGGHRGGGRGRFNPCR